MPAAERTYDLTLLLDSNADADRRQKILTDAQALIGQHGSVASTHDWGVRPTTYEIDKHEAAEYHLIQFTSLEPRPLLEELDRTLPITDGVLRYRIIKLKPGVGPVPDLTAGAVEESSSSDDDIVDDDAAVDLRPPRGRQIPRVPRDSATKQRKVRQTEKRPPGSRLCSMKS